MYAAVSLTGAEQASPGLLSLYEESLGPHALQFVWCPDVY